MFVIDDIISELVSQGVGKAQDKLIRNETVLKLLDKFNLKPDEPPNDVEGVYRFTLVEYGIGKPKPILELLRQPKIQEAFGKAFGQNNPSILLREVKDYIEGYDVGDEIKEQKIDYEREFAEFSALFIEIAKRARTPTEILQAHQIDKLQDIVAAIREQFERLESESFQIFYTKGTDFTSQSGIFSTFERPNWHDIGLFNKETTIILGDIKQTEISWNIKLDQYDHKNFTDVYLIIASCKEFGRLHKPGFEERF